MAPRKSRNPVSNVGDSAAVVDRLEQRRGTAALDQPYEVVEVPLAQLHANPQNQPARFKTHDEDLVRSISSLGLLQNPTVSAVAGGGYMILDGHRRVAALRALGRDAVPVRVMADGFARAFEVLITANGQRRDLDPVLESDYVAKLLEQPGWTIDHAAGELGRSREWVARRANLRTLGKRARKEREEGGVLQHWPIVWLEEFATLAEPTQDDLVDDKYTLAEADTFADLRALIRRELRPLADVKWPLEDADLVKKAGACTTCPKNSAAQPDLFGSDREMQAAHCRDSACYELKRTAWLKLQHAKAEKELGKPVVIKLDQGAYNTSEVAKATGAAVVDHHSVGTILAKPVPGARPVMRQDGSLGYEKPASKPGSSGSGSKPKNATAGKSKSLKEKEADLEARRRKWVVLDTRKDLDVIAGNEEEEAEAGGHATTWRPRDDEHALALVGAYGTNTIGEWSGYHDTDKPAGKRMKGGLADWRLAAAEPGDRRRTAVARAWASGLTAHMFSRVQLSGPGSSDVTSLFEECSVLHEIAGWTSGPLSWVERLQRAVVAIPTPKSWGKPPTPASAAPAKGRAKPKRKAARK